MLRDRDSSMALLLPPALIIALLCVGLIAAPSGCGSDDDDDDDATTPDATPTVQPTSPTPEPTPFDIWELPVENTHYLLEPYAPFALQRPVSGYKYVIWEGEISFQDENTIVGYNHWLWWKSTSNTDTDPPDCTMPESFVGTKAAAPPGSCTDCSVAYDITFSPMEVDTTCPEAVVSDWNGEGASMYAPWDDTWGLRDVATQGYPDDYSTIADILDGFGAVSVVYDVWITGEYEADYVVVPYCTTELTETCYPPPETASE